ncbi:MAG: response regulator [Oscillibacter sp.]
MPHRKKILLSDSNEAFSMLLADSLRERGDFRVFHARDTDETTEVLHRHRPHVLLLDFLLPHKGGFHVMQQLREGGHKISTIFYDSAADAQGHRGGIPFGRKLCAPEAFYDKGAGRTDTRCTAQ